MLEATYLCVDNSDYMRNGDFAPSRMEARPSTHEGEHKTRWSAASREPQPCPPLVCACACVESPASASPRPPSARLPRPSMALPR